MSKRRRIRRDDSPRTLPPSKRGVSLPSSTPALQKRHTYQATPSQRAGAAESAEPWWELLAPVVDTRKAAIKDQMLRWWVHQGFVKRVEKLIERCDMTTKENTHLKQDQMVNKKRIIQPPGSGKCLPKVVDTTELRISQQIL